MSFDCEIVFYILVGYIHNIFNIYKKLSATGGRSSQSPCMSKTVLDYSDLGFHSLRFDIYNNTLHNPKIY